MTKFPGWLLSVIALLIAFAAALYLRIALPWDSVFSPAGIKFTTNDAYYYMRLVDNLVFNFPHLNDFDPYIIYLGGDYITRVPSFFAYVLAGAIRLLGGNAPGQQSLDTIAVFVPAVLGALTVIPVFFIGLALVNRWAGLAAASVAAVIPGELLYLTLLGNTDHHATEVLLSSLFILFFMLAVQQGRQFTNVMLLRERFTGARKHILYSLIAGVVFGLYLISWQGASLLVFITFIFLMVQFISDHVRGLPTDYLGRTAVICFVVALLIMLPYYRDRMSIIALVAVILMPIALNIMSGIMAHMKLRPVWFPCAVVLLGALGVTLLWLVLPAVFSSAMNAVADIFRWRMEQNVVGEMKPLLFPGGFFTLDIAWLQFGLVLCSGLAGLVLLAYQAVRKGIPEHVFLAVLSAVMLLACLAMIRFASYLAVLLAVLTGYLTGQLIAHITADRETVQNAVKPNKKGRRTKPGRRDYPPARAAWLLAVMVAVVAVLVPAATTSAKVAREPGHTPPDAWLQALSWLRENSPEPFGDAGFYYALYSAPGPGETYNYPPTMYSVAGWIDYGYWITRIGHRVPVNNPGQWRPEICSYYAAQTQAAADKQMADWKARYVIIDNRVVSPNDKFYAVASLINKKESEFYELCWQKKEGKYVPLLVLYPDYYRSMMVRLYNFDGRQVVPQNTQVMAYQQRQMPDGQKFREITGLKTFRTYDEALNFISVQKEGNYSVIGTDPVSSPVPLEALNGYRLAYQSTQKARVGGAATMPEVKIFEYAPAALVAQ